MKTTILLLFAAAILLSSCTNKDEKSNDVFTKVYTKENLPISFFSIDADRDTLIRGKSGTKIRISKNTFVDSTGLSFHGSVNIELKEAFTIQDIVLGNMTTLSDGQMLQSGGMIYLNASSGNENLSIAKNNSIEVAVPSENKNEMMKIYSAEIDSETNQLNWINPEDLIVKQNNSDSSLNTNINLRLPPHVIKYTLALVNSEIKNIVPPQKPQQYAGGSDTVISLVFDTSSFPELAQYRNVKFKLRDNSKLNPEDSKIIWMSIDLKKTEEEGLYNISFSSIDKNKLIERSYNVSPVFEAGSDYKKAMEEYSKKYEKYESRKKEIEQNRIEAERKHKAEQELAEVQWKKYEVERQKQMKVKGINSGFADPNTHYIFTLKQLGWANIDMFYSNPNTKLVDIITTIENQKEFDNIYVSMIFDNEKIYISGYQKKDDTFGFTHGDYEKPMLPVGETAIIFATAYKNDVPYFAFKKITISDKQAVSIVLMKTTMEKLKDDLKDEI